VLKGQTAEQAVRTVVCREVVRGRPKKDRWHPLFTTGLVEPDEILGQFRQPQPHEQGYRVTGSTRNQVEGKTLARAPADLEPALAR
jgi:hypothetical protein